MPIRKKVPRKVLYEVTCQKCKKVIGVHTRELSIAACCSCPAEAPVRNKSPGKKVRTAEEAFSRARKGPAPDLPEKYRSTHFRSGWERNFARYLCRTGAEWTYERTTFQFHDVSRRPFGYLPDFYDCTNDLYYEVKGYLRSEDRSRTRRFRKQYPKEFPKLRVVCSKSNPKAVAFYKSQGVPILFYEDLASENKPLIPGWEG